MLNRVATGFLVLALVPLGAAGCAGDTGADDGNGTTGAATTGAATTGADTSTTTQTSTDGSPEDAPIVVDEPEAFDVVVGSFVLRGTADVFEGTVHYELIGGSGKPTLKGFVTASCGNGCRGTFRKRIGLKGVPPGNYTLVVFEPETAEGAEEGKKAAEGDDHGHGEESAGGLLQIPLTVHRTREG